MQAFNWLGKAHHMGWEGAVCFIQCAYSFVNLT